MVKFRVADVVSVGLVRYLTIVVQQKTGTPVIFELLEPARKDALALAEGTET